jgi:chorismate mutase/prephenate dehydratase
LKTTARSGSHLPVVSAGSKKNSGGGDSLPELRARIDAISLEILRLLSERARLAQAIGHLKRGDGGQIYQPVRERAVLEKLIANNPGPLTNEHIERIFTEVISACRALEHEVMVAYLGPEHTYTHLAALSRFGSSATLIPQGSIPAVFQAMESGRCEFGVVPVENSTEGSVTTTLDLLIDTPLQIVGEILVAIRHALLSLSGKPDEIRKIYSHQQSLAQCRNYLAANYPRCEQEAFASNALAAKRAAEEPAAAAIASMEAGAAYGLKVVAEAIQDSAQNTTRFLVLGKNPVARSGADKTTVLFAVADRVGTLNEALNLFARNRINMTKIESRPMRSRPWEYMFFADLKGHRDDPGLKRALAALKRKTLFSKVLGSYPEARGGGS